MVIIRQNNLQESMLLKISVRICPSFWYQMVLFRVLAHGLLKVSLSFTVIKLLNINLELSTEKLK